MGQSLKNTKKRLQCETLQTGEVAAEKTCRVWPEQELLSRQEHKEQHCYEHWERHNNVFNVPQRAHFHSSHGGVYLTSWPCGVFTYCVSAFRSCSELEKCSDSLASLYCLIWCKKKGCDHFRYSYRGYIYRKMSAASGNDDKHKKTCIYNTADVLCYVLM